MNYSFYPINKSDSAKLEEWLDNNGVPNLRQWFGAAYIIGIKTSAYLTEEDILALKLKCPIPFRYSVNCHTFPNEYNQS